MLTVSGWSVVLAQWLLSEASAFVAGAADSLRFVLAVLQYLTRRLGTELVSWFVLLKRGELGTHCGGPNRTVGWPHSLAITAAAGTEPRAGKQLGSLAVTVAARTELWAGAQLDIRFGGSKRGLDRSSAHQPRGG